ncbi:hypothetical protein [Myxococcus qinghaiensis]|uniref:hypothetical protein n=1 Tax=Myxococcus qinghaiensis TaxID=2906758 RepID=UPI0020A7B340|nr:hypothetical protein [Myxococcus qinghaiensis]MCP3168527.1 hypothetical protein [Myxococcus qinghaiensis]
MSPPYFVLRVEDPQDGARARLHYKRDQPTRSWMTGVAFASPPPTPILLELRGTDEEGWVLGDVWLTPLCVMSHRLHAVLKQAGVDNLATYPAILRDPVTETDHTDFVAFNLVGKRPKADPAGALLFRLEEAVNVIVIHDTLRRAIEAAGIDTLTFLAPKDFAG